MRALGSSRPLARGDEDEDVRVMNLIQTLEAEAIAQFNESKKIPEFRPGDTLRVGVKVVEGERTRVQTLRRCVHRALEQGHGQQLHRPQDFVR